jgi:hypothetical protein
MPSGSVRRSEIRRRRANAWVALLLAGGIASCKDDSGGPGGSLGPRPSLVEPINGARVTSDNPTFTIGNALGFDGSQATYTFRVAVSSTDREVALATVGAGNGSTSMRFDRPLLRGALLSWRVTGQSSSGNAIASDSATFRLPAVACNSGLSPFAKSVVQWWLPACSLANNHYNDPRQVLGPPDAGGFGPDSYFGFMSLGDGGFVTVDMGGCAVDGAGDDVRVYQSVAMEPVTLYASGTPDGPYVLVESRKSCGNRLTGVFSRMCTFDLAKAGLEEARYFKVEDGELFPCPGDTVTEGADIDAVEILNAKP